MSGETWLGDLYKVPVSIISTEVPVKGVSF